jgi:tetratricopeptide (TPR) repeat protein
MQAAKVMSTEKAKALLKFGMQAMREMRREDAEKAFRDAVEVARAAKDERLHARALARLLYALGSQGRAGELGPALAQAGRDNIASGSDGVAGLIIQAAFVSLVPPDDPECERIARDFVQLAGAYPQDLDVARGKAQVAVVLNQLGDKKAAKALLDSALPVIAAGLGASSPEYALMLHNLADLRIALGESDDAVLPQLRQAVAIHEASGLAPAHFERVMPLATLGLVLSRKRQYIDARHLFERARDIARAVEGDEGATPQMLSRALSGLDERITADPGAEPQFMQAVAAADKVGKAKPLELALALAALCRHYLVRDKAKAAEPHYRRLREIGSALPETEQAVLQAEMGVPGNTYALLGEGRGDEALKRLQCFLALMERVLPAQHPEVLQLVYFTGNVYRMTARHKDALRMFERYAEAERKSAVDDPGRADGLTRLLDAQMELGKKKDGERTAAEIERLTGRKPCLDPALSEFARQLTNVWHLLQLQENPDLVGAAQAGDAQASVVVGLCFLAGQGVPRNGDRARPWLESAARSGNETARAILDAMRGGTEPDVGLQEIANEAARWAQARGLVA